MLSLLFPLPGAVTVLLRGDLRTMMFRMSIFALTFAVTEFPFYPDYRQPEFFFNLIDILGFGIEDIQFVVGLSWLTSGVYPVVFRKVVSEADGPLPVWRRLAELSISAVLVTIPCLLLSEIALQRSLTHSTIKGHIAYYINKGTLDIDRLVPSDKISRIREYFLSRDTTKLTPARMNFGEEVSYGELRMVLAHMENDKTGERV